MADAPATVTDCGSLPAPGTWQEVWLPQSFLNDQRLETSGVAVDPYDQSVYVAAGSYTNGGSSGTGVYKSVDCGASFALASTGAMSQEVAGGDPWVLLDDPTNAGVLYAVVGYGSYGLYKSTDHGVDWALLDTDPTKATKSSMGFVQAIGMMPTQTQDLVVTFHSNCSSPMSALCLSQSSDGGGTWTVFNGPPGASGWTEAATIGYLAPKTYLYLGGVLGYTNDGGLTWTAPSFVDSMGKPMTPGAQESYAGSFDHGPDGTVYLATPGGVFASQGSTPGQSWALLANSPQSTIVVDDGVSLYATNTWSGNGQYGNGDGQVFWTAPLAQPTQWTKMKAPASPRGGYEFAYDSAHHILYSANMIGGLWRLVTR
jgi:hypothetical protein